MSQEKLEALFRKQVAAAAQTALKLAECGGTTTFASCKHFMNLDNDWVTVQIFADAAGSYLAQRRRERVDDYSHAETRRRRESAGSWGAAPDPAPKAPPKTLCVR